MADNVVDTLSLEVVSRTKRAENGINKLVTALGNLNGALTKTNTQGLNGFSESMEKLATSSNTAKNLNSYSKSAASATSQTQSLARAFGKLYANYFLVIRAIKSLGQNIEKSADYIEAYNYYNVAFSQVASQWSKDFENYGYENAEAYAESFTSRVNEIIAKTTGQQINVDTGIVEGTGNKSLGLDIQQMTQYTSELAAVTNSVGLTGEASIYASQALSMLAGDMSSLKNIDLSTVMNNFTSGLIGQSRALYKYGIDITNATLQTYAYELGLSKAVSEMSQSEKMQLRLLAILDQSEVAWGDLANTINSPSNMLRQFQANMSNLGRTIGSFFIPVLERVLPVVNGLVIALQRLMVWFANIIGIQIDLSGFGQGFSESASGVDDYTGAIEEATKATDKLNKSTRKWDELNNITSKSDSGTSGSSAGGGIDLTGEIGTALEEYQKKWDEAFNNMNNKAEEFANKLQAIASTDAFKVLATGLIAFLGTLAVLKIGGWAYNAIYFISSNWQYWLANPKVTLALQIAGVAMAVQGLHLVSEKVSNAAGSYEDLWQASREVMGDFFGTLYANTVELFSGKYSITEIMGAVFNKDTWADILDTWLVGWNVIKSSAKSTWEEVVSYFSTAISNWLNTKIAPWFTKEKWQAVLLGMKVAFQAVWNGIISWWNGTAIVRLWNLVTGNFNKNKWTFSGIKDGLVQSWNNAIEAIKLIWNIFANWLNNKLTWTIDPVNLLGKQIFPGTTINLGRIPTFYQGGFVPKTADLFMANENGIPELIGTVGGRTAVASGTEITGISNSIYDTANQQMTLMREEIALLKQILAKSGITTSEVFNAVRSENTSFKNRTGRSALA